MLVSVHTDHVETFRIKERVLALARFSEAELTRPNGYEPRTGGRHDWREYQVTGGKLEASPRWARERFHVEGTI